jgi:hypothetical protein
MTPSRRPASVPVYLETGAKKVFACSVDWPGWCRSGRTEEQALAAVAAYAPRYAPVAAAAGRPLPDDAADRLAVVERVAGSTTTDFGAPGSVPRLDHQPLSGAEAERLADLVEAAWAALDHVAAQAPATLRKGPRGGGRDRDEMVRHVLAAEAAYARKLGVRQPEPAPGDEQAVADLRAAITGVLRAPSDGTPPVPRGWPARYAARRIAWHVLDHAWEMADKADPAGGA